MNTTNIVFVFEDENVENLSLSLDPTHMEMGIREGTEHGEPNQHMYITEDNVSTNLIDFWRTNKQVFYDNKLSNINIYRDNSLIKVLFNLTNPRFIERLFTSTEMKFTKELIIFYHEDDV